MNYLSKLERPRTLRSAGLVTLGVIGVAALSPGSGGASERSTDKGGAADAVRQALRWLQTSQQDTHALTQWQHAALAQAYLNVARRMASDATIERSTRTHVRALSKRIDVQLQKSMSAVYKQCSKLKPPPPLRATEDDEDDDVEESRADRREKLQMRRAARSVTWA